MHVRTLSRDRAVALMAGAVLAVSLIALGIPQTAEGVGLPQIDFVSQGGVVSHDHVVNVSVTGDVEPGEVYYGVDVADPQIQMLMTVVDHYVATIDTTGLADGDHSVVVRAYNTSGAHTQVSQTITVDNTPPQVQLLTQGGIWGGNVTVTANVTDLHLNATGVKVVLDGFEDGAVPMAQVGDGFELELNTSTLGDGAHELYVVALDTADPPNMATSETVVFMVDNTPPEVTVTSTVPDYVMGEYAVTATVDEANLNASMVMVVLDDNLTGARSMEDMGDHFRYVINTSTEWMCGPHTVRVWVVDEAGHETLTDNVTLQVDNCPPMVTFESPGGHVAGFYQLRVNVTDMYRDDEAVHAVFDEDVVNRSKLDHEGDGIFTYTFDSATMPDGDHSVYVIATDLAGLTRTSGTLVLQVDNAPPVSTLDLEGGNVSGFLTVMGQVSDAYLNESEVYLLVDDDEANATEMVRAGERWQATLDTKSLPDGNHTLRLWAFDEWGQSAKSPGVLVDVDNHAPTIRILSGGGTRGGDYVVRANVTDPHLNTSCVKVKVGDAEPVRMSFNGEEWRYTVDTRMLPNGPLMLMVMACDYRGNMNPGESFSISVENRADLEIVSVEWVKTKVEVGQKAKVKVTVKNMGHSTAQGFDVSLVSGGTTLASATETAGIKPDKTFTYILSWKAKGKGTKTVQLKVDPADTVEETDETNNGWDQQTIEVKEESPGPGAALAVLALVGLAGALRRRRWTGG